MSTWRFFISIGFPAAILQIFFGSAVHIWEPYNMALNAGMVSNCTEIPPVVPDMVQYQKYIVGPPNVMWMFLIPSN